MNRIVKTPNPPYYAVIFTSERTPGDNGYEAMADEMFALAQEQPGFLGAESVRDGLGITVSYWKSLEAIQNWKDNLRHRVAQERGYKEWYQSFSTRVCKVERDHFFEREAE